MAAIKAKTTYLVPNRGFLILIASAMEPSLSTIGSQRCGQQRAAAQQRIAPFQSFVLCDAALGLSMHLTHYDVSPLSRVHHIPSNLRLESFLWMDIIHVMDIKHFDLNLLRVFDALLTEGQV